MTAAPTPTRPPPTGPEPVSDAARARGLRSMKVVATGLLVAAAVVYVVARTVGDRTGVVGLVEATAEAAMVGALADWFAVTALFRHPLGLPIPHTAIIPARKDAIGVSLGSFVQENFLDEDVLTERVHAVEPSRRLAEWLAADGNTRLVTDQLAVALRAGLDLLDDEQVKDGFERLLVDWLDGVEVAPIGGRVVEFTVDGGHHDRIVDAGLVGAAGILRDNRDLLRRRLGDASPWYVPDPIDDRVFDRLFEALLAFLDELASDPGHRLRRDLEDRARRLALELRTSPELRARGDALKAELVAHPAFREWSGQLWGGIEEAVRLAAADPDSTLRRRVDEVLRDAAARVAEDPDLQAKLDGWMAAAVGYVAAQAGDEVAELISTTVARWDTAETSRRIELQVGRDLQFIRINGTVVGGLAGAAIYLLSTGLG